MDEKVLSELFERSQANKSDEMKFSNEEADRFKNAFADPEFRKMFSEYMDEIQDPTYREETEQYISQLETEDKVPEGKQLIRPSPGFVAKTYKCMDVKEDEKDKVFINIVQSDKIAQPTKQSSPKGDCWSLPYSLGPPHMEKDKKGDNATCFDCCYHPMALQLGSMNTNFRNMLVTTAMDGVEEAYKRQGHKVTLERQFHIVKGLSYKEGQVPTMMVAISSLENWNQQSNPVTTATAAATKTKVVGAGAAASKAPASTNPSTDTKKKSTGPAIKKGFLNSAKSSIYEDKIPTIRPGANKSPLMSASEDQEEKDRIAQEEDAVSRLLGDLSINDKSEKSSQLKSSNTDALKRAILPLDEASNADADRSVPATRESAALAAAASALLDSKPTSKANDSENSGAMMKAVSSKPRAKPDAGTVVKESITSTTAASAGEVQKLPPAVPKVVVKHRENVSLGDFQGTSSTSVTSTRPTELIYEIQLPMVTAPSKIVLDVSERRLCLAYQDTYKLEMDFPYKVIDKKGKAAFDKSKKALIVTLPVEPVPVSKSDAAPFKEAVHDISLVSSTDSKAEDEKETEEPTKRTTTKGASSNNKKKAVEHDRWVAGDKSHGGTLSSESAASAIVEETESQKLKREVMEAAERAKQVAQQQQESAPKKTSVVKAAAASSASTTARLDQELEQERLQKKDAPAYIPAVKFIGRKVGYVFHMGDSGLGYYLDSKQQPPSAAPSVASTTISATPSTDATSTVNVNENAPKAERAWQSISYEVQETPQAIAFLLQVPNILLESVSIELRDNDTAVAVSFDAMVSTEPGNGENRENKDKNGVAPTSVIKPNSSRVSYANIFAFHPSSVRDAKDSLIANETHDVASKNMVLLLSKKVPGMIWQQSSVDLSDWLTVRPFSEASTPNLVPERGSNVAAPSTPAAAKPAVLPNVKSIISSMQFSSDLVTELD